MARGARSGGQIPHGRARLTCELTLDALALAGVCIACAAILAVDARQTSSSSITVPRRVLRAVRVRSARWFDITIGKVARFCLSPSMGTLTYSLPCLQVHFTRRVRISSARIRIACVHTAIGAGVWPKASTLAIARALAVRVIGGRAFDIVTAAGLAAIREDV